MAVSANRLELLQIADAVAREKAIDRNIVIAAMEDAIQKAARSRYGSETEVRAEINPKTGGMRPWGRVVVGGRVKNGGAEDGARRGKKPHPRRSGRRLHRRGPAAARIWPHRGPIGEASDRAEGARGRARPAVSGVQG